MPFVTAAEVATVAGAFVVFWFAPAVFGLISDWRRRPRHRMETATPDNLVVDLPETAVPPEETAEAPPEPAAIEAEPEAPAPPAPAEVLEDATHTFQLDDLRRARILEAPTAEALGDQRAQQDWEEGLGLADAHAATIGRLPLAASFVPQSRSFHGMQRVGERRELRFLLFDNLWPTATDQAAAEAVIEIGEAGVAGSRVVRRIDGA
jgi:hypothetical protein